MTTTTHTRRITFDEAVAGTDRTVTAIYDPDRGWIPYHFHPDILAAHAQFGGDLIEMQRRYDTPGADGSDIFHHPIGSE